MRVLYLVISRDCGPWDKIREKGQATTWFRDLACSDSSSGFFVFGDGQSGESQNHRKDFHKVHPTQQSQVEFSRIPTRLVNDCLYFNSKTGWGEILTNTLSAIAYALEHVEFDFIVRTNTSSYWNVFATERLLAKLEKSGLYAGNVTNHLQATYVEGDGIILSKDVAKKLVDHSHEIDASVIDDVAIGRILSTIGINPVDIPRPWVRSLFDIRDPRLVPLNEIHTFRCKTEKFLLKKSIRLDVRVMRLLHKIIKSENHKIYIDKKPSAGYTL